MRKINYFSEKTGNVQLRLISYKTFIRKKLRYICYDIGLGWNIYEDVNTLENYALTDSAFFAKEA